MKTMKDAGGREEQAAGGGDEFLVTD